MQLQLPLAMDVKGKAPLQGYTDCKREAKESISPLLNRWYSNKGKAFGLQGHDLLPWFLGLCAWQHILGKRGITHNTQRSSKDTLDKRLSPLFCFIPALSPSCFIPLHDQKVCNTQFRYNIKLRGRGRRRFTWFFLSTTVKQLFLPTYMPVYPLTSKLSSGVLKKGYLNIHCSHEALGRHYMAPVAQEQE